jgi:hypothetical protein
VEVGLDCYRLRLRFQRLKNLLNVFGVSLIDYGGRGRHILGRSIKGGGGIINGFINGN